jgi:hypothetical protein
MEPISLGLLMALVGGASGEMGKQAWTSLTELVRRPFHRSATVGHPGDLDTTKTGEAELTALEHAPDNAVIAEALSQALAQRAAHDPDFRAAYKHGMTMLTSYQSQIRTQTLMSWCVMRLLTRQRCWAGISLGQSTSLGHQPTLSTTASIAHLSNSAMIGPRFAWVAFTS